MIEVRKQNLIAAYLIATAFVMGQASMWNQYACPGEGPIRTTFFAAMVGVIWPLSVPFNVMGGEFTEPPKCLDGTLAKRPAR